MKKLKIILLLTVSISIILYMLNQNLINLVTFKIIFSQNIPTVIFCLFLNLISIMTVNFRFFLILKKYNIFINYTTLISINSISNFFSQIFPGNLFFAESFKILFLTKKVKQIGWIYYTFLTFIDKSIGLSIMFFLSSILIFFNSTVQFQKGLIYLSIIFLIISIVLLNLHKILSILKKEKKKFTYRIGNEVFVSILASLTFTLSYYLIFKLNNFQGTFFDVAALMPFITISFLLPIGIAGIGGQQIAAISIFYFFEKNLQVIGNGSLMFAIILLISNSLLGIIFVIQDYNSIFKLFKKNVHN